MSEDYKQDHCCVKFGSNDKRSKIGVNLSFFNFPSNDLLRSKWTAATRQDEGPDFEVSESRVVTSELLDARVVSDRLRLSIAGSVPTDINAFVITKQFLIAI